MLLAVGVLAALREWRPQARGKVVDAAMTTAPRCCRASSTDEGRRALEQSARDNLLDGAAHFYDTYACADGRYVAVGASSRSSMPSCASAADRRSVVRQAERSRRLAAAQAPTGRHLPHAQPRPNGAGCLGADACVAPVLDWDEAPLHPH
jgi:alpha-methylacyl-CoA racemase